MHTDTRTVHIMICVALIPLIPFLRPRLRAPLADGQNIVYNPGLNPRLNRELVYEREPSAPRVTSKTAGETHGVSAARQLVWVPFSLHLNAVFSSLSQRGRSVSFARPRVNELDFLVPERAPLLLSYSYICNRFQVMVTSGGNQAFAMVALALLDPGDRVLLVRPNRTCTHTAVVVQRHYHRAGGFQSGLEGVLHTL